MLSPFYKWLYHFKKEYESRARLSGRGRRRSLFKHFERNTIHKESFGKYETPLIFFKRIRAFSLVPIGIFLLWFAWESIGAIGIFQ